MTPYYFNAHYDVLKSELIAEFSIISVYLPFSFGMAVPFFPGSLPCLPFRPTQKKAAEQNHQNQRKY